MKNVVLALITVLTLFATFASATPTLDQSHTFWLDAWSHFLDSRYPLAQTFTTGITGGLTQVSIPFAATVTAPMKLSIVEMYNSQPIGSTLGSVDLTTLSAGWNDISFADQNIYLTADTKYAMTLDYYGQTPVSNGSGWKWTAYTSTYSRGDAMMKQLNWKVQGGSTSGYDFWFRTYMDPDFVPASTTVPTPSAILLVTLALPIIGRLKRKL